MNYVVKVRTLPPQHTVVTRVITHESAVVADDLKALLVVRDYLRELEVLPASPPLVRNLVLKRDYMEQECGYVVPAPVPGRGGIQPGRLPGGRVAVTWHTGPYELLYRAFSFLRGWMREHGYVEVGPQWELLWAGPDEGLSPEQYKTEVLWPFR